MSFSMSALVDSVDPDDCNRRIFELAKTIDRALQDIFKLISLPSPPNETKPLQPAEQPAVLVAVHSAVPVQRI